MAHKEQADFCTKIRNKYPDLFCCKNVLDVGSLDINGNNRYLFDNCSYCGVDVGSGNNVDIISKGHELMMPDNYYDLIISTECFEHDMYYKETIFNIIRMLKIGGLFLFTCASDNRPEHGTRITSQCDAPLLEGYGDWFDYYKNLNESDIREFLDVDSLFSEYLFEANSISMDLYFYGIKK